MASRRCYAWSFARWDGKKAVSDPKHLYLKDGFKPGWLYDLIYIGKNPRISGLGFVAVRDACTFFKHSKREDNPLAGRLRKAYIFGISQSARFIHHFLYEGFNTDEKASWYSRCTNSTCMPRAANPAATSRSCSAPRSEPITTVLRSCVRV